MSLVRRRVESLDTKCVFTRREFAFIRAYEWLDHWADMAAWYNTSKKTRAFLEDILMVKCTAVRTRSRWNSEPVPQSTTHLLSLTSKLRVLEVYANTFLASRSSKPLVESICAAVAKNAPTLRALTEYAVNTENRHVIDWPKEDAKNPFLLLFSCPLIETIGVRLDISHCDSRTRLTEALCDAKKLRHLQDINLVCELASLLDPVLFALVFGTRRKRQSAVAASHPGAQSSPAVPPVYKKADSECDSVWTRPLRRMYINTDVPCANFVALSKIGTLTALDVDLTGSGGWEELVPLLHLFVSLTSLRVAACTGSVPPPAPVNVFLPLLKFLKIDLDTTNYGATEAATLKLLAPMLYAADLCGLTSAEVKWICESSSHLHYLRTDGVSRATQQVATEDSEPFAPIEGSKIGLQTTSQNARSAVHAPLDVLICGYSDATCDFVSGLYIHKLRALEADYNIFKSARSQAGPECYTSVVQADLRISLSGTLNTLDDLARDMPSLAFLKLRCKDISQVEGDDEHKDVTKADTPCWNDLRILAIDFSLFNERFAISTLRRLLMFCKNLEVLFLEDTSLTPDLVSVVAKYAPPSLTEVCFDMPQDDHTAPEQLLPPLRALVASHPKLCCIRSTDDYIEEMINENFVFQVPDCKPSLHLLLEADIDVQTIHLVQPKSHFA